MSYSRDGFETRDNLKVYTAQFSSSAGSNYTLVNFDVSDSTNRFIPYVLVVHYDTLTGNWGGTTPTYNLGYTSPFYADYFSSGVLDVSSRVTNNMTISTFTNANANNGVAISGSQQIVFRWNVPNSNGTITGTLSLVGYESYGY